jgi:hypothetical protein
VVTKIIFWPLKCGHKNTFFDCHRCLYVDTIQTGWDNRKTGADFRMTEETFCGQILQSEAIYQVKWGTSSTAILRHAKDSWRSATDMERPALDKRRLQTAKLRLCKDRMRLSAITGKPGITVPLESWN